MTRTFTTVAAATAIMAGTAYQAMAVPSVSLHASNVGIDSIVVNVDTNTNTITIDEVWDNSGPGNLQFDFDTADFGITWRVIKNLTNNSGDDWTSLATELLDPAGDANDAIDPMPTPPHVPGGFSTSNDTDNLFFNVGVIVPTSDVWGSTLIDVNTDARDFVDYFNGTLANGGTGSIEHGVIDNFGENQPFLLSQRPNAFSRDNAVPEPLTASLGIISIGALGYATRRR